MLIERCVNVSLVRGGCQLRELKNQERGCYRLPRGEVGLIQSSIGIGTDIIYSSESHCRSTSPIRVSFHSLA